MGPLTWEFLNWDWVIQTLIVELAVVIIGVFIANYVMRWWKERKYGKWNLIVRQGDEILTDRSLSAQTSEIILSDETDLDVFLKGRVSVFGNVQCDLVSELKEPESKVIKRDDVARTMTITLGTPCARGGIGIVPWPQVENKGPVR